MAYGHVYVAQVAMGAKDSQTLKALIEAESYPGPSLVIAYSHCIAHGYDLCHGLEHQKLATESGYWPLYRYDPRRAARRWPSVRARLGASEGRRYAAPGRRVAVPDYGAARPRTVPRAQRGRSTANLDGASRSTRTWRNTDEPDDALSWTRARTSFHARRLAAGRQPRLGAASSRMPAPRPSSCARYSKSRSCARDSGRRDSRSVPTGISSSFGASRPACPCPSSRRSTARRPKGG